MAETFLFNIADQLLGKLSSHSLQTLCSAWGGESEREKLESTLSTIRAVLLDAEEQQEKNRQLTNWLGKLKDALYDAEDVLDELQYEASQNQVVPRVGIKRKVREFVSGLFCVKVGDKIKEIREKLDEIAAEKAKFHLTEQFVDRRVVHEERKMTHSFVRASDVIGRDVDKENIVQFLMHLGEEENVSTIPIVGIGGLGKTTLAKLVYNDEGVSRHFNLKMWVCVSEDFDVTNLTKEIYKSATRKNCDDLTIDQLQIDLRSTLANKRFLLVLDDVWNDDRGKWIELRDLLLGGASRSKIIVTTRSQLVASIMGTIPAYNLKGLSHEECLSLFVKWAFKEGEEKQYPNLLKIGDEIVKKCRGVPLAVRTLGSLLYLKTDERDWLFVKDNEIWKLEQKENDILPALRLSYNQMPSYLKQCFAFCSIFPKDYNFNNEDLIQMWMSQGLLQSSNENQELEDLGERYIKELWSRSFFQDFENNYGWLLEFKMHDLVHDLALLVSQTECCSINFDAHNISKRDINVSKRVRHVSFFGKDLSLDEVPRFLLKLENLRTILFPGWGVGRIGQSFVETCISRFKYMRVLDLSDSCFEVLPSSIGNLKHLRYLRLCENRKIKKLPNSFCKLQNLLHLRFFRCSELGELPKDIGKLINLRCLLLTTKQMFLPEEGIGCLNSLRYLGIIECGNLKSLGKGLQHLTNLRKLSIRGCQSLEWSLSRNMKYLTALEILDIANCEKINLTEWEEDIQGLRLSLRWFLIGGLQLMALPQWLQGAANTLQGIRIVACHNIIALPEWLENLTSLKKLEAIGCTKLSVLPEGMCRLTTLRELKIQYCSPELSRRCRKETGEDWPKIAHVPKITLDGESDSECRSQHDDVMIHWLDLYESQQQEIACLKEENRVLLDMVVSGRSARDEAGPSGTASVPQLPAVAFVPSPSTAVPSQTQSHSSSLLEMHELLQQEKALLKKENRVLQDMVVSGRSTRDEAGPSGTASVLPPSTVVPSQTQLSEISAEECSE